jgi:hypothetical protein
MTRPANTQEPHLGLATTEEMFREIIARFSNLPSGSAEEWAGHRNALVLAEMLGGLGAVEREYRTVDG